MNKANSIINKFLLAGDKFMPELHLVDPIIIIIIIIQCMWTIYKTYTKNSRFFKYRQVKLYLQK